MSTSVRKPGAVLDTGDRGLCDPEAGGDLPLGANRPLHLVCHQSNMRSSVPMLVLTMTDLFKVIGVHARRLMAQVVKVNATRQRPVRVLIQNPVGLPLADQSVAAVEGARPQPAVRAKASIGEFVSRLVLSRVVAGKVVERFSLDVPRASPVYGREGCLLTTTALTQARWVINAASHGPVSVTALTAGGGSH